MNEDSPPSQLLFFPRFWITGGKSSGGRQSSSDLYGTIDEFVSGPEMPIEVFEHCAVKGRQEKNERAGVGS